MVRSTCQPSSFSLSSSLFVLTSFSPPPTAPRPSPRTGPPLLPRCPPSPFLRVYMPTCLTYAVENEDMGTSIPEAEEATD